MSETSLIENQWVDIVLPTPPDSQIWLWWSLAVILVIIIAFSAYWFWQRQPRQQLKRNMKLLLARSSTIIEPKIRLRQLEKSLCQHYQTAQLSQINLDNTGWAVFQQQLQQACYQAQAVNERHAIKLIKQAQTIFLETNS